MNPYYLLKREDENKAIIVKLQSDDTSLTPQGAKQFARSTNLATACRIVRRMLEADDA
jgi:hypothetical protein